MLNYALQKAELYRIRFFRGRAEPGQTRFLLEFRALSEQSKGAPEYALWSTLSLPSHRYFEAEIGNTLGEKIADKNTSQK